MDFGNFSELHIEFTDVKDRVIGPISFASLGRNSEYLSIENQKLVCKSPLSKELGMELLSNMNFWNRIRKLLKGYLLLQVKEVEYYSKIAADILDYVKKAQRVEEKVYSASIIVATLTTNERVHLEQIVREFTIPMFNTQGAEVTENFEQKLQRIARKDLRLFLLASRLQMPLERIRRENKRFVLLDVEGRAIHNPDYPEEFEKINRTFSSLKYIVYKSFNESDVKEVREVLELLWKWRAEILEAPSSIYSPEALTKEIISIPRFLPLLPELRMKPIGFMEQLCKLEVGDTLRPGQEIAGNAPYFILAPELERTMEMIKYYLGDLYELIDFDNFLLTGSIIPACFPHHFKQSCNDKDYIDFYYPGTYTIPDNYREYRIAIKGPSPYRSFREKNEEIIFSPDGTQNLKLTRVAGANINLMINCPQEDFDRLAQGQIGKILLKYPKALMKRVDNQGASHEWYLKELSREIVISRGSYKQILWQPVAMTRGYIGKERKLYLSATAHHSLGLGTNYNYYPLPGKQSPMEIILKYQQRGFKFNLPANVKKLVSEYQNLTEKWNAYGSYPCRGIGNFNLDNLEREERAYGCLPSPRGENVPLLSPRNPISPRGNNGTVSVNGKPLNTSQKLRTSQKLTTVEFVNMITRQERVSSDLPSIPRNDFGIEKRETFKEVEPKTEVSPRTSPVVPPLSLQSLRTSVKRLAPIPQPPPIIDPIIGSPQISPKVRTGAVLISPRAGTVQDVRAHENPLPTIDRPPTPDVLPIMVPVISPRK